MNYFDHPFCSNSNLSALKAEMSGTDAIEYADALRFGTLVHALILEPEKVDLIRRKVGECAYTPEEMAIGKKMKAAFIANPFCNTLLGICEKEVEMYNADTSFEHNQVDFTLPTRRKYDLFNSLANWGADIKSTTATNHSAFLSAINRFDYDRARVFYAKGPRAVQDVIIGICKYPPHQVFVVTMRHGDDLWQSGEQKMNELAYKYWALKYEAI